MLRYVSKPVLIFDLENGIEVLRRVSFVSIFGHSPNDRTFVRTEIEVRQDCATIFGQNNNNNNNNKWELKLARDKVDFDATDEKGHCRRC